MNEFVELMKIIWEKVLAIVKQPYLYREMLWILLPLLAALFLIELYFSRYKKEELGWNTAVSNSLVLFFVGLNLCSFLHRNNQLVGLSSIPIRELAFAAKKSAIAYFITLEAVFLLILNFFHLAGKRFAFGVSSGLILNFIGMIGIIFVYSPEAWWKKWVYPYWPLTVVAIFIIFIALLLFFLFVRWLTPGVEEELEE